MTLDASLTLGYLKEMVIKNGQVWVMVMENMEVPASLSEMKSRSHIPCQIGMPICYLQVPVSIFNLLWDI